MNLLRHVVCAAFALSAVSTASAAVLVFDSSKGTWSNQVANDYGEYNTYQQDGFMVQTTEGDHTDSTVTLNFHDQCCNRNNDIRLRLSFGGERFDFLSFKVNQNTGVPLQFLSSENDSWSLTGGDGTTANINMLGATWIDFWLDASATYQYADLDDFVVRAAEPAQVPEPGSLALIGLALAGLVGVRRRSRT